ncbi:hypothetical protein NKH24_20255 [Mesorhizobium sp. M1300]|uniref:hypothetical protein n=1 Tax=Mesorhizobium sp. M1300 TaxID=2957077 RepID=UPI00333998CC
MTPFRWQNCYADVAASRHDRTIRSYLDEVILPALISLDRRIDDLGRNKEPWAAFEKGDIEDVLRETKMAFALAMQSIWERQLRSYLLGCARELRPGEPVDKRIEGADWKGLRKLFSELRGIGLEAFPSFEALDTLQLLGNACRHGDGASAVELSRRCADLWRPIPPMPFGDQLPQVNLQTVGAMDVPIERLCGFVDAIVEFWEDAEYIYNESIQSKHPSLESRLARERAERKWVPQAARTEAGGHGE